MVSSSSTVDCSSSLVVSSSSLVDCSSSYAVSELAVGAARARRCSRRAAVTSWKIEADAEQRRRRRRQRDDWIVEVDDRRRCARPLHVAELPGRAARPAPARSASAARRPVGDLEVLERPADVAAARPNSGSRLLVDQRHAARRRRPRSAPPGWPAGGLAHAAGRSSSASLRAPAPVRPAKVEPFARRRAAAPCGRSAASGRSAGTGWPWLSSISALPRNSTPPSASAKWNRARIRACVSALKYISVLRQISRSIREIGASWTRSLRPKITERRRSLRKT